MSIDRNKTCLFCGQLFYCKDKHSGKGRWEKRKFCSQECYCEYKKIQLCRDKYHTKTGKYLPCYICGKLTYYAPSILIKNKNHYCSVECKAIEQSNTLGEMTPNWQGGIYPENQKARRRKIYFLWKIAVFTRDNYICQKCGRSKFVDEIKLNAHHIKSFSKFPELRYAIDNGITYCETCHRNCNDHKNRITA